MKTEEIPRIKFTKSVSLPCADISDECAALLGYAAPSASASDSDSPRLASILADLDIEALDATSVERYQFDKLVQVESQRLAQEHASGTTNVTNFWKSSRSFTFSWSMAPLSGYKGTIPEYVLRKAVQIKKACPDVDFHVEGLSRNPDPFLIASIKTGEYSCEAYYIEVWDEPGFKITSSGSSDIPF